VCERYCNCGVATNAVCLLAPSPRLPHASDDRSV
jgi:hypothetical protein